MESHDVRNMELRLIGRFVPGQTALAAPDRRTFISEAAFDPMSGKEIKELRGAEISLFSDFNADYDRSYEIIIKTLRDNRRLSPGVMVSDKLSGTLISARQTGDAPFSLRTEFDKYRASINGYVLHRFKEEPAALISAIVTGETAYLGEDLKNAFNVTGLAHILSISGSHFALFSVMTFGIFLFLIRRLPYPLLQRLTIYLTPSQAAAIFSLPLIAVYLGISGSSPPAVRSFVMIGVFLAGLLFGRKGFWLNSLLLAACLLVLWDPEVILSLSFQLSFLAVLFIGFAVEKEEDHEEGNRFFRFVKSSVKLTVAATLGTFVPVAYYFHYFSIVSPLSNLLVAPFMGFVLVPSAVFSSLAFLVTGHYILAPIVSLSADLSIMLVRLIARIPFADVKIPSFPPAVCIFFYSGFAVYFLAGRKKRLLFLPFVPIVIYAAVSFLEKKELAVTFLDVGQGDSEVVELPGGRTIVVDTGRTGKETAAFLKYRGKKEIDALVLSHSHPDHSGGLDYLLHSFSVNEVWDNGRIIYPAELNMRVSRRGLERGDQVDTAGCCITVLHPYREFVTRRGNEYDDANESSLVLKVSGRTMSVLLPGDIGEEAEEDICHAGSILKSDIVKIPHHGSRTSANEEFLSLVSPSIAVISVGKDNSFGHPSPEVLEKLSGKMVFRTDMDGAVEIRETEKGPAVKTYRDFRLKRVAFPEDEWSNIKKLFEVW